MQDCRVSRRVSTDRACLGSYLSFGAEFRARQQLRPLAAITVIKIYYEYCCQMGNFKRGFTNLSDDSMDRVYCTEFCPGCLKMCSVYPATPEPDLAPGHKRENQFHAVPDLVLNYEGLFHQNTQILVK